MKAPSTRPAAVLGLDVGKSSHWACLIDRDGEVLASAPVRNREAEFRTSAPDGESKCGGVRGHTGLTAGSAPARARGY